MPYKLPEVDRVYHRNYMRGYRAGKESLEQREQRLAAMRIYTRKKYRKRLKELGLALIGKGHRRRWKI